MSLYYLNVTVHVLAALLWLGGMFFLAVVGAPVLRKVEPPTLRAELFRRLGERYRRVGWGAIAVLVATGLGNLQFRGLLSGAVLGSGAFWATSYGQALAWKLGAVATMLVVSGLHDFVLGPAASRAGAGTPDALRFRRWAALLARLNAVAGVVVVIAAVLLARGG
ncbi:MAG TPA: CopD family protein [Longimicrobiales bacterium]